MANWDNLKSAIEQVIKQNGNQEITGEILQNTLKSIVNNVGKYATFAGIATPETNPGTPDGPVFYLAATAGTYVNFGNIELTDKVFIIFNTTKGVWSRYVLNVNIAGLQPVFTKINNSAIKELYVLDRGYTYLSQFVFDGVNLKIFLAGENLKTCVLEDTYTEGKIYALKTNNNITKGYIVLSGETISYSGSSMVVQEDAYNIASSPDIMSYLLNDIYSQIERNISDNELFNKNIKELFIRTNSENSIFTVSLFCLNYTDGSSTIVYLQKDGVTFARFETTEALIVNKIYKFAISDNSDDEAYIVFTGFSKEEINKTSISYVLNKDIIFNYSENPIIEKETINALIPSAESVKNWTKNKQINEVIKELYIENISSYNSIVLTQIRVLSDNIRIFLKNGDDFICTMEKKITLDYYDKEAITPLYKYKGHEIVGWVILKRINEDVNITTSVEVDLNLVGDINNSPTIGEMLNADEQIILTGDSLQGLPPENSLPDLLRGITKRQVWNISCGGCMMAWRTTDGSNYYDKFSFSTLMNSISTNDFTEQLTAISGTMPTDYSVQYANMTKIDNSKKTTIICNYMANDIRGGSTIGELWNYTDTIDSYARNTFLGALNFGVSKVLSAYSLFKFIFLGNFYRLLPADGETERTQPPYYWTNNIGKKAGDYIEAAKTNCKRLGLPCHDIGDWGIRNYFSMGSVTTDGTHYNPYGFYKYSQYLLELMSKYLD